MKRILFGELRCHRVPCSKALRRLAEKRISDWAESHLGDDYPKGLTYQVTLERISGTHIVDCSIRVSSKTESWFGADWAELPEQALSRAVARLRKSGSEPGNKLEWARSPAESYSWVG